MAPASPTCSCPLRLSPSGKSDDPEVSLRTSPDCVRDSAPRPAAHTFASYGSREREIMRKVHFSSSTGHSPWTAFPVPWVPVYCFPTLSLSPFAMCVAFLRLDYYGLFDFPMWPRSFVGLSLTYFPPSFTSTMGSPVFNK